jgi:hypothetical protein
MCTARFGPSRGGDLGQRTAPAPRTNPGCGRRENAPALDSVQPGPLPSNPPHGRQSSQGERLAVGRRAVLVASQAQVRVPAADHRHTGHAFAGHSPGGLPAPRTRSLDQVMRGRRAEGERSSAARGFRQNSEKERNLRGCISSRADGGVFRGIREDSGGRCKGNAAALLPGRGVRRRMCSPARADLPPGSASDKPGDNTGRTGLLQRSAGPGRHNLRVGGPGGGSLRVGAPGVLVSAPAPALASVRVRGSAA